MHLSITYQIEGADREYNIAIPIDRCKNCNEGVEVQGYIVPLKYFISGTEPIKVIDSSLNP